VPPSLVCEWVARGLGHHTDRPSSPCSWAMASAWSARRPWRSAS